MSLKSRLSKPEQTPTSLPNGIPPKPTPEQNKFREMKNQLHLAFIEKINSLGTWDTLSSPEQDDFLKTFIEKRLDTRFSGVSLSATEKERIITEIKQEVKGFGPLDPFLRNPNVSEIMINGYQNIYIEINGILTRESSGFKDDRHLLNIIERIVSKVGRRIDETSPMVDARLPDGSRVNAIIPPLSIDGPALTIRKFKSDAATMQNLLYWGAMTVGMAETLKAAVAAKLNIVISGGTGSGKTTLLNSLSAYIPERERIVTIEDSAELSLQQNHVVRLETRPANIEGTGEVTARDLVKNTLRMRPDRVIIGECRGAEALDMLQAMNTGHDGSLTTIHANTPRDACSRLEILVMYAGVDLPEKTIRQQISSAVHLLVQVSRLNDGTRRITHITEVMGVEGSTIVLQDIFKWEQYGTEVNGRVIGCHVATGVRPSFTDKCKSIGIKLSNDIFDVNSPVIYMCKNPPNIKAADQRKESSGGVPSSLEKKGGGDAIDSFLRKRQQISKK